MGRVVMGMLVAAIVLDMAHWTIWFTNRDWTASEHTRGDYDFENAFPLADLWLGGRLPLGPGRAPPQAFIGAVLAGVRRERRTLPLGPDLLDDLENGVFASARRVRSRWPSCC